MRSYAGIVRASLFASVLIMGSAAARSNDDPQDRAPLRPIPLRSDVVAPQPLTGLVLWQDNEAIERAPVSLEFAYLPYAAVVDARGDYDWSPVERLLEQAAARRHQLVLRWYDTYVGKRTGVPASVTGLDGYRTVRAESEGEPTEFPDWSHPALPAFVLEFFERFAERYDRDPRLAYLQVGFGLWSEYHIYDGPMRLGETFPSLEFQRRFAEHLDRVLIETRWMVSVDAANDWSPLASDERIANLGFGLFDDSFNHKRHAEENAPNWRAFGEERWRRAPAGGEFSFFEPRDQRLALAPTGPHGIPFETQAAKFHLSFIIADAQPEHQSDERLAAAGLACGYRFRIERFEANETTARIVVANVGIAPIPYDAFVTVDGRKAERSLRDLLPGESRTVEIVADEGGSFGDLPKLEIVSPRMLPGVTVPFEARLD
ncbi:MAG TPA: DUF4832 domain-containing protein [Pirellulaceae bacterium]|nr:DUF4832 domain-containing protein [Pirellulaceae bacterium]